MQRLGPGRRAKHLEVQTMWVQQLAKIGLISPNKLNTPENVADPPPKHVPRAVLDKLAGMMCYTFPREELQSFRSTRASIRITRIRKLQQLRNCLSSTMEKMNRWRMTPAVLRTNRPIPRQPFRGGATRRTPRNDLTHTDHRDLLT